MSDVSVFDNGNGGDWQNSTNDIVLVNSLWSQPYLAMFGGNIEQSTPVSEDDLEGRIERFDWWGNSIGFPDDPVQQFNSVTERTLNTVSMSNEGIQEVQKAVLEDLTYLSPIAEVEAVVTLDDAQRIRIAIRLIEPGNLDERNFVFLWDGTRVEQIVQFDELPPLPKP